jgi:prepilin-type N-terminal cleavage/methylation domain-containing protein
MRKARRGFTLIEAMIVVVVVSILSLLAYLAYHRWVQTAYMAEATNMVKAIRQGQEAFKAENGGYVNVSTGLGVGSDYPAATPGQFKTGWGGQCAQCNDKVKGFSAITVSSNGPVAFGYSTVANAPTSTSGPTGYALTYNGSSIDLSSMTAPWYLVEADGDTDGNGVFCNVYGFSNTNQLYVNNEGE